MFSRPSFLFPSLLLLAMAASFASSAYAAVAPSLGAAATYAVLSSTFTNTTAGTTINGDIGFTTGPAVTPGGTHAHYGSVVPYAVAGDDQNTALSSLATQLCTFSFPAGAINLSTDTTHGPIGVYAPGVYCSAGAMNVGGPILLNGNGTYIFRAGGALTSTAGSIVSVIGASPCNVFWTPTEATTLAANTTFIGTVIDAAGITVGANTTWTGRALAFGGTVTTAIDSLTVPTCAVSSSSVVSSQSGSSVSSSSPQSSSVLSSSSQSSSSVRSSSSSSSSSHSSSSSSSSSRSLIAPPAPPPVVPLLPKTGIGPDATGAVQESFDHSWGMLLRNFSSLFLNVFGNSLQRGPALPR